MELEVADIAGATDTQSFVLTVSKNIISADLDLSSGWHLISLPVTPDNSDLTYLFPDAVVAYKFGGTYQLVTDGLEPGTGYWVKVNNSCEFYVNAP